MSHTFLGKVRRQKEREGERRDMSAEKLPWPDRIATKGIFPLVEVLPKRESRQKTESYLYSLRSTCKFNNVVNRRNYFLWNEGLKKKQYGRVLTTK